MTRGRRPARRPPLPPPVCFALHFIIADLVGKRPPPPAFWAPPAGSEATSQEGLWGWGMGGATAFMRRGRALRLGPCVPLPSQQASRGRGDYIGSSCKGLPPNSACAARTGVLCVHAPITREASWAAGRASWPVARASWVVARASSVAGGVCWEEGGVCWEEGGVCWGAVGVCWEEGGGGCAPAVGGAWGAAEAAAAWGERGRAGAWGAGVVGEGVQGGEAWGEGGMAWVVERE